MGRQIKRIWLVYLFITTFNIAKKKRPQTEACSWGGLREVPLTHNLEKDKIKQAQIDEINNIKIFVDSNGLLCNGQVLKRAILYYDDYPIENLKRRIYLFQVQCCFWILTERKQRKRRKVRKVKRKGKNSSMINYSSNIIYKIN